MSTVSYISTRQLSDGSFELWKSFTEHAEIAKCFAQAIERKGSAMKFSRFRLVFFNAAFYF
jgi:hypothetical protein